MTLTPDPMHLARVDACLDAHHMRQRLHAVLPGCADGSRRIEALRISKTRRNTSRRRNPQLLTLCYDVDLHDPASGQTTAQRLYAKVYRDPAEAAAMAAVLANATMLHLAALGMLLWPWPADPGLPQLAALLDARQAQPWWGQAAAHVETLRYEPETRATLRYSAASGNAGAPAAPPLYAKTFRDDRGAAVHHRFVHFWSLAEADPTSPLVAEPLAYTAETRTLWQAAARGTPLVERLAGADTVALAVATARAIARLHAQPLTLAGAARRDRAHWLSEVGRRSKKIGRAAPEYAERVARLAATLAAGAQQFAEPPPSLIHGDFHPDQVWVDNGRIVLFDFDEFAPGDPMEDLAEFVIKLDPPDPGGRFATLLIGAYAQAAPQHFGMRRLHWHLAVQGLLQASRAFVFQVEGWRGQLERRLARAEAFCDPVFQESVR